MSCLILPELTDNLPSVTIARDSVKIPPNLFLADHDFNVSRPVDILIGVSVFWSLLCVGQIKLNHSKLILQKTLLGWVIAGNVGFSNNNSSNCFLSSTKKVNKNHNEIHKQLEKFWTLEELPIHENALFSAEEIACEKHFEKTVQRDSEGRFIVELPFKDNVSDLGNSYHTALNRFKYLERKFRTNSSLKSQYCAFINEYIKLEHMSKVSDESKSLRCYFPHHAVFKQDGASSKIRVVFDGSAKTDSGISLNDVLMVGPTLQDDLFSIILRFRIHNIVIICDIEKMYRQISVAEKDRIYQNILWRENEESEIETYELNTITYGTASASYQAIKALRHLARLNAELYPEASKIILRDFYVDDLITGGNNINELQSNCNNIISILKSGKFELRKWISNNPHILQNLEVSTNEPLNKGICFDLGVKCLGLLWQPQDDMFKYSLKDSNAKTSYTKRTLLARVSQIFDPLGVLGPIIINAKLILEALWQLNIKWDESLPEALHTQCCNFFANLNHVNEIQFHRHVVCDDPTELQIHSFSDASEVAYGACVYLRSTDRSGISHVNLLCAKSKVAPLKTITIPRLELCAALLSAKLVHNVKSALQIPINKCFYWSDSSITLSWIKGNPNEYKIFVANRISHIQNLSEKSEWFHIPSDSNPADLLSRGVKSPLQLKNNEFWWKGPQFLRENQNKWPVSEINLNLGLDLETKNKIVSNFLASNDADN